MHVCAGIVLLFLTVMHVISKQRGWSPFNVFRTAVCVAIAVGLALMSSIIMNPRISAVYLTGPWVLPVITISYFVVLVLTHLPHPNFGLGHFHKGVYTEVEKNADREGAAAPKHVAAVAVRETSAEGDDNHNNSGAAAPTKTRVVVTGRPGHASPPSPSHGPANHAPLIPFRLGSRAQRK